MSDIKLFSIKDLEACEIQSKATDLEKSLQVLIEKNLDTLLGVTFLASEYPTGKSHGGRIDTLGIDENYCPIILEYKRSINENVINQGLYYLDWLLDHKAEFWKLTAEKCGQDLANMIDWSTPRLICIATDFTKFDEHAIQQINRNIELLRYRMFGSDLLLLEGVNRTEANKKQAKQSPRSSELSEDIEVLPNYEAEWEAWWPVAPATKALYDQIYDKMFSLGDDVQIKFNKQYIAFKRLRNFASLTCLKQPNKILLFLHLSPDLVELDPSWMRDVRKIGIWGSGQLELTIKSAEDVDLSMPLIRRAYLGG